MSTSSFNAMIDEGESVHKSPEEPSVHVPPDYSTENYCGRHRTDWAGISAPTTSVMRMKQV